MARTASDDPAVLTSTAGFDRHQRAAAAGGPFSFMDDDDPDLEQIVRSHASATGKNPDKAWTDEHTRRHPAPAPAAPGDTRPGRSPATPAGSGRTARPSGSRSGTAAGRPSSGPSIGSVSVDDGAGLLLGLFAYALAHAFLVAGPAGAKAWLAAKFLNRTGPAGTYAATPHPDYPINPSSDGPDLAGPPPGMFRQTAPTAMDYRAHPSSDGPGSTYPAGPWQQTAPIPGGVLR